MRRSFLSLSWMVSIACCAPPGAPLSVSTGLAADLPLAALDDAEARQACEGWLAYSSVALADAHGPLGIGCALSAVIGEDDPAACEAAYAACLTAMPSIETICDTDAHSVPDCDRSVTVRDYESCMTTATDRWSALDIDCRLAGNDAEIHARLLAATPSAECAALQRRSCEALAPAGL